MVKNPFNNRESNDYSAHPYKREKEIKRVLEMLDGGQSVSIIGPHKIGKTRSLHDLSDPITLKEHGLDPQRNLCVYIDLQEYSNQPHEAQIYTLMLDKIGDAAHNLGVDLATASRNGHANGTTLEQALKDTHSRGLKTFLLLDEFDALARNPNIDGTFFSHLRALTNANDINVAYVTASRDHLVDLLLGRESPTSQDFFNIFMPVQLGLLSEQDSLRLVKDLLHRAEPQLGKDLLDLILQMGGGHPFFLQMAAHQASELVVNSETTTEDKQEALWERFSKEARKYFKYHWQELDHQAQNALTALPSIWRDLDYQEAIEQLRGACLITWRNDRYDYFSPLFEAFVQSR